MACRRMARVGAGITLPGPPSWISPQSSLIASRPQTLLDGVSDGTTTPRSIQQRSFSLSRSMPAAAPLRRVPVMAKKVKRRNVVKAAPKPPAEGERRQFKKQVTLGNPNALPVPLPVINADTFLDEQNVGKMVAFPDNVTAALSSFKAFKPSQAWAFFNKPAVLVRPETVRLAKELRESSETGKPVRKVLVGPSGSGKSVLLAQALSYAHLNNWIVLYIPEGRDVVLNRSEYSPIKGTNPPVYQQPQFIQNLLKQIRLHRSVLECAEINASAEFPPGLPPTVSLLQLCEMGSKDTNWTWPAFRTIWRALTRPNTGNETVPRPPILFALDGLSFFMDRTEYLTPSLEKIHAHDLAIVRHFVGCLSGRGDEGAGVAAGKDGLGNGGAAIAAMSSSGISVPPSLRFALDRAQAVQARKKEGTNGVAAASSSLSLSSSSSEPVLPVWNGYKTPDVRVIEAIDPDRVDVTPVGPLDFGCTRSLVRYYSDSGLLRKVELDRAAAAAGQVVQVGENAGAGEPVKERKDVDVFVREQLAATGGVPAELERQLLRVVRV